MRQNKKHLINPQASRQFSWFLKVKVIVIPRK